MLCACANLQGVVRSTVSVLSISKEPRCLSRVLPAIRVLMHVETDGTLPNVNSRAAPCDVTTDLADAGCVILVPFGFRPLHAHSALEFRYIVGTFNAYSYRVMMCFSLTYAQLDCNPA